MNQISAAKRMTGGNKRGGRRREQNKEDLGRLSRRHESNTPLRRGATAVPVCKHATDSRVRSMPTWGAQECGGAALCCVRPRRLTSAALRYASSIVSLQASLAKTSTVEAKTIEIRQILDSIGNEHRQQVFMVHLFPNQQDKMSTKFTIMGEIIFEHPIFHYIWYKANLKMYFIFQDVSKATK